MKKIYLAKSDAHADEEDKRPHNFVSIDGDSWLEYESSAPLTADDYDEIADKFAWHEHADGSRSAHIKLARRYLRLWCKNVVFYDPIEVPE